VVVTVIVLVTLWAPFIVTVDGEALQAAPFGAPEQVTVAGPT
jgi:hypothetical protein